MRRKYFILLPANASGMLISIYGLMFWLNDEDNGRLYTRASTIEKMLKEVKAKAKSS